MSELSHDELVMLQQLGLDRLQAYGPQHDLESFMQMMQGESQEVAFHESGLHDQIDQGGDVPAFLPGMKLPQFGPPFVRAVMERFDAMEAIADKLISRWAYEPQTVIFVASMQTTGTGGLSLATVANSSLYEPPPGFTFALHRLFIKPAGYTFGTPYTNAGSYWELRVNDEAVDGNSMISGQGQLPTVLTYGTRDAPRVRDGEVLSLFMSGGPASAEITVKGQGTFDRTVEG